MSKKNGLLYAAGGAAVAGFGASFGRDVYNKTKKGGSGLLILVMVLGAFILPLLGGAGFTKGHNRGAMGTLFKTIIGNSILIALGLASALVVGISVGNGNETPLIDQRPDVIAVVLTAGMTILGMLIGLVQRGDRLRGFSVDRENTAFLTEQGITETDGKDITHYDSDGNSLRFIESHGHRLVFMVVGKRGKRAYIDLDQEGRMLSYSGVEK